MTLTESIRFIALHSIDFIKLAQQKLTKSINQLHALKFVHQNQTECNNIRQLTEDFLTVWSSRPSHLFLYCATLINQCYDERNNGVNNNFIYIVLYNMHMRDMQGYE